VTPRAIPGFHAQMTDADLVRRVLEGDTDGFTSLVDRYAAACMRIAMRMLGNREDAEDATQETFVRAYRSLGRYQERDNFRTWLFQILVNRCRTAIGREQRRRQFVLPDDGEIDNVPAAASEGWIDLRDELRFALAGLPPEQREAFLLKHLEMLSYEEMAVITGVRVPALKMRVKRACDRLQRLLKEDTDGE
jgi:RNA polymerase sigma-70 factor (ECF subfamily)